MGARSSPAAGSGSRGTDRGMLPRSMRSQLLIAALAAFGAAWLVFAGSDDDAPPAPGSDANPPTPEPPPAGAPASTGSDARLVATRVLPAADLSPPLAAAPTACLLVLDHATGRPIAGAPVRRLQGGGELAFTDARGLAPLPLPGPEQLAIVVDGFLLRIAPTHPGSSEEQPQEVRLVRDEWSIVRRFEFDGAGDAEVFVRFLPTAQGLHQVQPPSRDDAFLDRAWTEHTMLAGRPACADVPVQLGAFDEQRVHRLRGGTEVRFTATGTFALAAATPSGLVGSTVLRVEATPRTGAPPIRVRMTPGAFVSGVVVSSGGTPIAAATLTLQGGEPLGLLATTAADGSFRFGPLLHGEATLHVRHGEHEPLAFGPVTTPATDLRIALQALPGSTLRGRVRARPHGRPLAGATVQWLPASTAPVVATTGDDGTFALRATGTIAARLSVSAPGYLAYAELVDPGAPFADYDLWPGTTAERLASGITALLEGVVLDHRGAPVEGAEVRWQPAQRPRFAGLPGRRVLAGAALELPDVARTGSDGSFRLETLAFGPGRLFVADGGSLDTTAAAGATTSGLRLLP